MTLLNSDKELVESLMQGNNMAYKHVYDHYYSKLCRFALRFIEQRDDAEEIVQNTIFKIWENKEKLSNVTNLSSYLYRSVQNSCLNQIKHEKIKQSHISETVYLLKEVELEHTDILISNENEDRIKKAIESLPDQCRRVLELSKLESLKNDEIAEKLNMSKKSVEMNLYRALNKMRILLQPKTTVLILLILLFLYSM